MEALLEMKRAGPLVRPVMSQVQIDLSAATAVAKSVKGLTVSSSKSEPILTLWEPLRPPLSTI